MKLKSLLIAVLVCLTTTVLTAQTAKIIRMTGTQDVLVTFPDGNAVPGVVGLAMPVDSLIEVNEGTRLFFKTFEGQITVVEAGSVVFLEAIEVTPDAKERTVIELRGGDLVANLDPKKRGTNDYGVRTPKGVAAARGTNYTVSVNGQNVVVTVVAGIVSINIPDLGAVTLNPGSASTGGAATSIGSALSSTNSATAATTRAALQAAAAAVAVLASDPTSGVTTETLNQVITTAGDASKAAGDTTLLSQVAASAAAANPSVATAVVTAAVKSDPAAATSIVTSVTNSVTQATAEGTTTTTSDGTRTTTTTTFGKPTAAQVQSVSQNLTDAANEAALSVNSDTRVDVNTVSQSVRTSQDATPPITITRTFATPVISTTDTPLINPTDSETSGGDADVVVDNTIVTVFSTFTIRLSDARFVAVTVNNQNKSASVRSVSQVQGTGTTELGNGKSTTFTVPASVTAAVGPLDQRQFDNIAAGIRAVLQGPVVTVPGNTIVVSPSS